MRNFLKNDRFFDKSKKISDENSFGVTLSIWCAHHLLQILVNLGQFCQSGQFSFPTKKSRGPLRKN